MKTSVTLFAIATLLPVVLLATGAMFGDVWIWIALAYMTVLVFSLDMLVVFVVRPGDSKTEFPAAQRLSVTLALAHFFLMALAVWVISGGSTLSGVERVVAFFGFGLFFGQVSNSNAHELIHRPQRSYFELGKWVYISMLFGHHTSAHRLVHHRFVGSEDDPNSARLGESYYGFVRRAWWGSFVAGMKAEARLDHGDERVEPYVIYIGGALMFLGLAAWAGGLAAVMAYVGLAAYATAQLLMSDYVQHYGLRRRTRTDGSLEPVGVQHSWNAPHWYSGLLMLNAPRHSDHHSHPGREFVVLELPEGAPILPRSLPVMGFVALFPRWWRRLMDHRVEQVKAR